MKFHGVMTAIVTPFRDGRLDEKSLRSLIDWQIKSGVDAIVPCGTTGEAAALSFEERERIIRIAVEQAGGRAMVFAGAGSNSTDTAIKLARQAKAAGADGHLQVTPYYNKPMQEGLYQHFEAIAAVVDLPMILYNVPGRTAVNMLPETVARLSSIETIFGIKEASGNIEQIKKIIAKTPPDFCVYSGDDAMNFEVYRAGGRGAVSVTANVAPSSVVQVWDSFKAGEASKAEGLQSKLEALNKAMFLETNPIPVKTSLAIMGRCVEEFRLPMTPMSPDRKQELRSVLKQYRLLP